MKKIAIIDNQFAHGTSLGSGDLKIYPKNFVWDRSRILENHYLFITEGSFNELGSLPVPADRKIAFIIEPQSINQEAYNFIQRNWNAFAYVLSHDKEFNRTIPNALHYPFGGCWIKPEDRYMYKKTKLVSIIASEKREAPGHRLRHEFIEKFASKYKIDVFGRAYNQVEYKLTALKDYAYSIVIENEKSKGWFTEKLIDCFVTGTIPIYWGDPEISQIFKGGGFNLENFEELMERESKYPGSMLAFHNSSEDSLKRNFELAKKYVCPEDWIFENYPKLFV